MNDSKEEASDGKVWPAWCHPTRAKDMEGISGEFIRDMMHNDHDELYQTYGIRPDEAALSLHCAELASLLAWDSEAIIEAATVYQAPMIDGAKEYGEPTNEEAAITQGEIARIKRRVHLAIKAENAPDVMTPADGVLLLRRAGINVFHELLDAVAVLTLRPCTDEAQSIFRLLMNIPERPQAAEPASAAPPAAKIQKPIQRFVAQDAAILNAIRELGYDPLALPKPDAGKRGVRADIRGVVKHLKDIFVSTNVFDDAWQRLRDNEDIRDA